MSKKLDGAELYCLREHSEIDIEHAEEFMNVVRAEQFTNIEQDAILNCAKRTMVNSIEFISSFGERKLAA